MLNGHADAVMSLVCWNEYLLSCSLDRTIKVWAATEDENIEVIYTHDEEYVSGINSNFQVYIIVYFEVELLLFL